MKTVTLALGDRNIELRYNLYALAWFEKETGLKITQLNKQSFGANVLLNMLYAGMLWKKDEDPSFPDLQTVGKWIDTGPKFYETADKLAEVMNYFLEDPTSTEKKTENQ